MPALDGLRGLAVVLVLACHAGLLRFDPLHPEAARPIAAVMSGGWIGVDLFFVLSGFLITGILLATRYSAAYYKSFFARRFLRIFPLYYVVVALTVIKNHSRFNRFDVASLVFFFYNWRAVYLGHHLFNVEILWSLAVEEQFYILWPTVVLFCSNKTLIRISVAGIFFALVLRLIIIPGSTTFPSAYYLTPCRMDALLVGALLAIWRTDPEAWKRVRQFATATAFVSMAVLAIIAMRTGHFYSFVTNGNANGLRHTSDMALGLGCSMLAILFGAMVVRCTGQGNLFHVFNWWPLRRIGKYSYGIYMLHWWIVLLLRKLIGKIGGHLPSNGLVEIVCFILLLGASFGMAFVSFHLFEKHFLKLKRLFPAVATQV